MSVFVELPSRLVCVTAIHEVIGERDGSATLVLVSGRFVGVDLPYEEVKRRINEAIAKAAGVPRFIRVADEDGDLALIATDNISAVMRAVDDDDGDTGQIHFKNTDRMLPTKHTVSETAALLGLA